jgi:hypothetical protein
VVQPPFIVACGSVLFAWHEAQVGVGFPACGSWQPWQRWWPAGADFCSAAWHVPHAAGAAIVCTTDAPWHETQSA